MSSEFVGTPLMFAISSSKSFSESLAPPRSPDNLHKESLCIFKYKLFEPTLSEILLRNIQENKLTTFSVSVSNVLVKNTYLF